MSFFDFGRKQHGARRTPASPFCGANPSPGFGAGTLNAGNPRTITAADIAAYHALTTRQAARLAQMGVPVFNVGAMAPFMAPAKVDTTPPLQLPQAGISVGELVGWRIWVVRWRDQLLQSYSAQRIWLPGEPMRGEPSDHGPEGVWAFRDRELAEAKLEMNPGHAIGSVWLWGNVVEHRHGFRAEFAEIRSIDAVVRVLATVDGMILQIDPRTGGPRIPSAPDPGMLDVLRQRYKVGSAEEVETAERDPAMRPLL